MRAPKPSEHKLQVQLMDYLAFAGRTDLHWFAIPNGEKRHVRVAVRLKAEGVRRGTPDLCFMLEGGRVGWLEMKRDGGKLSPDQLAFLDTATRLGHLFGVARSINEALAILTKWDVLKPAYRDQTYNPFGMARHAA